MSLKMIDMYGSEVGVGDTVITCTKEGKRLYLEACESE